MTRATTTATSGTYSMDPKIYKMEISVMLNALAILKKLGLLRPPILMKGTKNKLNIQHLLFNYIRTLLEEQ